VPEIPVAGKYESIVKGFMPCPLCVIDPELSEEILRMSVLVTHEVKWI